jgi:hypothetical protein
MLALRSALGLGMFVLGGGGLAWGADSFALFRSTWGDVVVATDTTEAGKELVPPTPEAPVYYRGMSLGCKLGAIPGDAEPVEREVNALVAKVLAQQGYRGARRGVDEPSLFLVVQWGYLKPGTDDLYWFLGYDYRQDVGAQVTPNPGPEVFRRGMRSRTIETILEGTRTANYGIIVTAFEFKSANTADPVVYWQTRIALPASGKSMQQALPTMIVAAGPSIGRPTDTPKLHSADRARSGTVRLGELNILDVISGPAPGTKLEEPEK